MNKRDKQLLGFKNTNNYLRHLVTLFSLQCSQFVYEGLSETLPQEFLEYYLALNGTIAIGKVTELGDSSELYIAMGAYNGNYNGYLPEEYTAAVTGIGEISGKWYGDNKTIVVGKNNLMGSPEFDIPFTAEVLSQVDISEKVNVIFARLSRIPYADNDTEKTGIESAIKAIVEGDVYAVANRNVKSKFEEFLEQSKVETDKFLDLVDVDKINGLQYLNQYRDNVMKRFLSRRGYMVQTTSKLAQQTNSEIHGSDSYALLYPLEQLRERQKMVKNINSLFGTSITVRFNEILEKVYRDYMTDPENKQPNDKQPDDKQPDDKQPDDKQPDDKQPDDKQPDDKQSDDKTGGDE